MINCVYLRENHITKFGFINYLFAGSFALDAQLFRSTRFHICSFSAEQAFLLNLYPIGYF